MDDNDLYPKQLFHERIEIMGDIASDTEKISNLHIIIQYQLDKPGDIIGYIYGTYEEAQRLDDFFKNNNSYKLRAVNKSFGYEVSSNQVFIESFSKQKGLENSTYKIGKFILNDIRNEKIIEFSERKERQLTFFLAGPANTWGMYWTHSKSYTGDVELDVKGSQIDLNKNLPFEIELIPWYFHDNSHGKKKYDVETFVYAYSLKTNRHCKEYSDDNFIQEGIQTVDKLVSLSSLVTGSRVVWYGYSIVTNNSYLKYYRLTPDVREDFDKDYLSLIVNGIKSREFLSNSYNLLCDKPKIMEVLNVSLNYYLDGMDYKKPIDEQFILLFLALEKIKDIHGKNKKLTKIITNGKFSKICKDLKEVIQKSLSDNESKFMIEKLSELNRVSLKRVLENLFDHYDIDISDLYPIKADVYPFISIRNKLFHSRTEIDDIVLLKESVRLEYILSRIFLRMLGWSDLSMAPGEYNIWINELRKG